MLRSRFTVLFGALLVAGALAAQAPAPNASVPAQAPAPSPNPGQGGTPTQPPPELTHEQQEAQVKARAEHMAELQMGVFARQLNLTAPQVARLRPILADRQKQLQSLVVANDSEETPANAAEHQAKALKIQQETEIRIKGILTPTQKAQYERLIAMHRAQRNRRAAAIDATRRARLGLPPSAAPGASATPANPAAAPAAPAATPTAPPAPATPPQQK